MKKLAVEKKNFLRNDLSQALEKEQIFLVFQSKVDAQSKKIIGAEVLLRWHHPEYGLIPTEQWILWAESYDFLPEITRWLVVRVAEYLTKDCFQNMTFSVNVSPKCLDGDFADFVLETLRNHHVSADKLMLEITESAQIINMKKLVLAVKKLRLAKVKIALDDFGSGFSSLKYLIDIPVDAVKIDKEFVQRVGTSEIAKKVFKSLIDLANDINVQIIVEGVETQEEYEFVKATKSHAIQGFFFSKPVLFDEFRLMVEKA